MCFLHDSKFFLGSRLRTNYKPFYKKAFSDSLIISARPVKSLDTTHEVFPTYVTYDAMLDDDTHASSTRGFPEYSACHYRGLRKPFVTNVFKKSQSPQCHRRQLTPSDCTDTVKYFGQHGTMTASQCDTNNAIKICTISERENYKREDIEIKCDVSACNGNRTSLGIFSDSIGKIKWQTVRHIESLSTSIKNHILSSEFAPGFVQLKCEGGQGIQVLSFPKILDRMKSVQKEERRRFNINIVLEDSLSRAHFYRTLLKTASTFRDIIYNQSIPSTLLEFEKVQGYVPNTYNTLQRLFTGRKYWNFKTNCDHRVKEIPENSTRYSCTYGLDEMLSRYQRAGYSTLFQEDHCWFDDWGSFLDPRKGLGRVNDEKTRLSRWREYVRILETSGRWAVVEDYGMSILTCDAYKKYKVSNPYSSRTMPKMCFAGRHYSSFFLEYVKRYTELNDMAGQPFFAYTHLLTSHDTNGKRVVDDDEGLADFFRHAAHLRNTVTIFLSDHGGKATDFAANTTQGREEVFQPLLFMIVPHKVSKMLGPKAMDALVVNQNRLVGVEDLYHSLVSILDTYPKRWGSTIDPSPNNLAQQAKPKLTHLRGLFEPIPFDRTCEQMKIRSDALCLCEGMDTTVPNDSAIVQWAAEFALGTLNNRIQDQYTTALRSKSGLLASDIYGYGKCQRYTGTAVMHARQHFAGLRQKLIFSLFIKPLDLKKIEIFSVEVSFPKKKSANGITLHNLIRVSQFNKYEKCTDKGVEPKLCACHADQQNATLWRNELYSKAASLGNLNFKPQTQILDRCLTILSRVRSHDAGDKRTNAIKTFEAVNACPDVTYNMIITFKETQKARVSLKHPKTIILLPRTVTFLLTANVDKKGGIFILGFKFEKRK